MSANNKNLKSEIMETSQSDASGEKTIRSMYEAMAAHDLDSAVSCFSDDGQFTDVSTGTVFKGKKEIRAMMDGWLKAFPDLKMNLKNIMAGKTACAVEFTLTGTHKGPLEGPSGEIAATGKSVNVPSCDVIRLKNGKVQSLNCYFAATVLMSQIGGMSARAAA